MASWTISGVSGVNKSFRRVAAVVARESGKVLDEFMDANVSWIRSRTQSLFNSGGKIANHLWHGPPKITQSKATTSGGWAGEAAAYGYVLERGPDIKREWTIRPKGLRADGEPITALRLPKGPRTGGVEHYRFVVRRWNRSQLRKHWEPAIQANRLRFVQAYKAMVRRAWRVA